MCGRSLATVATVAVAAATSAQTVEIPAPGTASWQPLTFPRIDSHTRYEVVRETGSHAALRAVSDCSASALWIRLEDIDLRRTPRLSWRWRVERGLEIEDERSRAGDDFAARVYVMFPFDSEDASLWERTRRGIGERLYGRELPGHSINYVWTSRIDAGSQWTSAYTRFAHLVAVRRGPSRAWHRESVDLLADHRSLVGEPRMPPMGLAVMSDSDNSCQQATAYFADFRFTAPDPGAASRPEPGVVEAPADR